MFICPIPNSQEHFQVSFSEMIHCHLHKFLANNFILRRI